MVKYQQSARTTPKIPSGHRTQVSLILPLLKKTFYSLFISTAPLLIGLFTRMSHSLASLWRAMMLPSNQVTATVQFREGKKKKKSPNAWVHAHAGGGRCDRKSGCEICAGFLPRPHRKRPCKTSLEISVDFRGTLSPNRIEWIDSKYLPPQKNPLI